MRTRHTSADTRSAARGICVLTTLITVLVLTGAAAAQTPQAGLANGFEIDGNLLSNGSGGVVGHGNDWLDGISGPGAGVLEGDPDGTPKNPVTTLHILDLIKNDDLNIFGSSNKVFHDPNTYAWKGGGVPQKDDIQNGLVDFTTDLAGNRWISVAGDRRAVNGDSYIDFEFLQTPLYMNPDGSFSSAGPDGGRTMGDILLTIHLSNGGSAAGFFAQRWESDGNGGYTYIDIPIPAGSAFVAADVDSQVVTTYDAFGQAVYDINQFGEAAVNLTTLLPSFDECFGIATVFIRTKASTSEDAGLKDFLEPIQVNICLDEEPPVLDCPPDITVSCEVYELGEFGASFATDNCTDDPSIAYSDSMAPGACAGQMVVYRTWKATDDCGNFVECSQTITVVDDQPPIITSGPQNATVECGTSVPPPDGTGVIAQDECGQVTVAHLGDVSDNGSCPEVITRTYRASDDCGNYVDYVQTITIDDTTPPEVSGPDGITVQCSDDVPAADIGLINATDNCGGVTVDHVGDSSNAETCAEVITRTYRATDACGNTTDFTQTITIDDTTLPVATGPDDMAVACSDEIPQPDTGLITASDNCSTPMVAYVGDASDGASCPEVITRTYRVTDECGNSTDVTQTFTVNDTIAPSVAGPDDITIECVDDLPDADIGVITASDNCGGVTVAHVGDSSDGESCPETITRTYRVTDSCGNATDYTQSFTIFDTTDPEVTCASDITVECVAEVPSPDIRVIQATDNCGGVTVTHLRDDSDGRSCPQVITRVYRATDACGNWTECTQTITVDDTTPPAITSGPGPLKVSCEGDVPPADPLSVFATDNCSEVSVAFLGDVSDGNMCPEKITRTYRVYDDCGNWTDHVQQITVDDEIPPQINVPDDVTLECPDSWDFGSPTATDNCDPAPAIDLLGEGYQFGPEPWTMRVYRVWGATDACNNVSGHAVQRINLHCEPKSLCTFTQGFYGNYGGYFNGASTIQIIRSLLEEPLVVGKPGRSLSISRPAADCIVARLSSGVTPTTLPEIGDANMNKTTCQTNVPLPLDSNGKFVNVLLGQTITLTLNTRYNWPLLMFPLQEKFCTQAALPGSDGLYGTDDDVVDPEARVEPYFIPASVLSALDAYNQPLVVWGLLDLANRGLAGLNTYGATLSEINDAVDAINNGFRECRIVVDCIDGEVSDERKIGALAGVSADTQLERVPTVFELGQNRPNPFNPSTRIQIALPEASDWALSVYNVSGQLVRRFEGSIAGAAFVDIEWNGLDDRGRPLASGVYFYRITAGRFVDVKKMVLLK